MKRTLYLATLLWCWALLVQAQSQINGTVQVHPGGHMGVFGSLNFNTGYVITPRDIPGDNIYFTTGSVYTGVSDGSHVNGYAEEAGNASFMFPIGDGTTYRPASIASASSSVNYRAAYFSRDPNTAILPAGAPFSTTSRAINLIDVSTKEYWDIDGSSAANITLSWNAASDLNNLTTGNANTLVIAGWDGTKWVNLGRAGGTSGLITGTGTITATNIIPDKYQAYTFAKLYCPLTATVSAASYTICAGATISLTSSTTGVSPALLTYIWTGPNSYSASGSSVNIPNATVSALGAYTLVISDASGCSLTAVTPPIIVKPTPVISSITVNQPRGCNSTDTGGFILNGLTPGTTYQIAFLQNTSPFGPTPQTANASGQIIFNGFSPGAYTNITATLDGCPSNVVSATLVYPTVPVPVLSVNPTSATICLGQSFTLSAVGASSGPNATFTFAGPGISSTTSNSAVVVTPSAGGTPIYTATQSASGCTSAPATISVTVNAPAVISSITPSNPTACATNTGSIQLNGLLPNTQYTVAYTRNAGTPTSTTYISNASGQVVITGLLSGTYTAISTSQGSCVGAASASTIVLADPNLPALTGYQIAGYSPTSCGSNTGRIDFTGLPANTGGIIINYTKNGVTTLANVSTDASGKATIFNLSAGNYANFTYQIGGCVSASSTVSVNLNDPGLVPLTSANVSSLNPTSCGASNGSITLAGLASNTSMAISYQRNGINSTASVTTNGAGQAIIASLGAGAYTVITYTIGTCTAAPFSGTVAISDPGLTPLSGANVIGKAPSFCGGANGHIDITGLAGNQLVTINYKKDGVAQLAINAVSSASGQVTITSLSQGVYNDITYTIGSCTSAPYLGNVNLLHPELTAPQFTIINPAICGSNTGRIEITGLSGNQSLAVNFAQNGTPVVVTVTTDPTGKAVITGLLSATYTNFSYSVGACTSTVYSGPAYLSNPAPTVLNSTNVLGINPTQCGQVNGRIEITGLAGNVSTTINYRRNGSVQAATVLSDASGKAVIMGLSAGAYSDFTYTQGTCTSAPYVGPVNLLDPAPTPLTSSNITPFNPTSCTATDGRIEFTGLASNITTVLSYMKDGIPASATVVSDASGKATLINLAPGNYANFSYSQGTCTSTPYSATLVVASVVCNRITMRLYLQGALFNNGGVLSAANLPLMRDDLRVGNYIPLNDPYRTPSYASLFPQVNNTEFQTIIPSMLTTTGDKAIVDWVFIELRDKTNPSTVKYTRSGLVLRNGTVMDTDGQSTLNFTSIPADNYYVAVRHRNHLGVMTAQTIAFPSSTVVDFINMTDVQVWNNTGYDGVERSNTNIGNATVWALWAGNAVHNNKVKYNGVGTDLPGILSDVFNYPNSGNAYNFSNAYGYLIGDVNMDGRALYIGAGNDGAFVLSNVLNYPLNSAKLYNYDLFYQQLP